MPLLAASTSSGGSTVADILIVLVSVAAYLAPTIIVLSRRNAPSGGSVVVINLLLGWTVIGWIVALAMAVRSSPRPQYVVPDGWGPQPPMPPQAEWRGDPSAPTQPFTDYGQYGRR